MRSSGDLPAAARGSSGRASPTAAMWWAALCLVVAAMLVLGLESRPRGLVLNTLKLSALTCAVSVPLGTLLALLLVRTNVPARGLATVMVLAMMFVPLYLVATAWQAAFGPEGWLAMAPWFPEAWRDPHPWFSAVYIHATAALPWIIAIVATGIVAVEPELEEHALLCAPAWLVLWRVTLRRAAPAVGAATLWVAVSVAGEIMVTDIFQIRTFAEEVYVQSAGGPLLQEFVADGDPSEQETSSLLSGTLLTALLVAASLVAVVRIVGDLGQASLAPRRPLQLGKLRPVAAVVVLLSLLLLMLPPLVHLAYKAGVVVISTPNGRLREWSLARAAELVASSPLQYHRELAQSLWIAAAAATAAVGIAILLAWCGQRRGWVRGLNLALAAMLLAVPGPLLGVVIIAMLNQPEDSWLSPLALLYDENQFGFAPWLAQSLRALPLATLVLWPGLASVASETIDAARVEGASAFSRLVRIILPQRLTVVTTAWLVCLVASLGELPATILVYPPGVTPVSVRIFNLVHYGVEDRLAGLALFLYASTTVCGMLLLLLVRIKCIPKLRNDG